MGPETDEGEVYRGGAWKVAYADFVTALMSLFIVLWLMNSSPEVQDAVSSYFRSPRGHEKLTGTAQAGSGQSITIDQDSIAKLKQRLQRALQDTPALRKLAPHVQFTVTGEGLRIEIMENFEGVFFENASAQPTGGGLALFQMLAGEIARLPNQVVLEGHTDSKPFHGGNGIYGNWELSFERANTTRRVMLAHGVRQEQIAEIRGYADRQPITPDSSQAKNRRISVILLFTDGQRAAVAPRA
jgi:chemotaxis protein MotB